MIHRSGFLRSAFALAGASLFAFFAACGGKIDGGSNGPSSDGGIQTDDSVGCNGAISCPVCLGETNPPTAQCLNGEWVCPTGCEQQNCDLSAPADCKCGTPSCQGGEWVCPQDCSDTCPADIDGLAGTACSVEGLICGGEDCTNPCDFCNFIGCQNGVWVNEESPPEPCPVDAGTAGGG